jgi:DNA-binding IscR family transcriptional regulator
VKVTAKADYAVRAVLELTTVENGFVKGERIARAQKIPLITGSRESQSR